MTSFPNIIRLNAGNKLISSKDDIRNLFAYRTKFLVDGTLTSFKTFFDCVEEGYEQIHVVWDTHQGKYDSQMVSIFNIAEEL